jgi:hypothetical protein
LDDLIDGHLNGFAMVGLLLDLIEPRLRDGGGGTIGDLKLTPEGIAIAKARKVRMKVGVFLGLARKSGSRCGEKLLRVLDGLGATDDGDFYDIPGRSLQGPRLEETEARIWVMVFAAKLQFRLGEDFGLKLH